VSPPAIVDPSKF